LGIIFQAACADQVNADIRLAAALRFKNRLRNEDCDEDWKSPVQKDEEVVVRKALGAVIMAPSKVRSVLLEELQRILTYDSLSWEGLVTEVMQGLNMHKITGALSVLRVLCKRFEYNSAAPLSPQNSNSNSLPHLTSNGSLPPMPPGPVAHLPVPRPRRAIDVRLAPPPAPLSAAGGLVLPPPAPPAAVPGSGLRSSAMPDGRLPGFEPMRVCPLRQERASSASKRPQSSERKTLPKCPDRRSREEQVLTDAEFNSEQTTPDGRKRQRIQPINHLSVCPLRQDPGEFPVVMEAIPRVGCTTLKQKQGDFVVWTATIPCGEVTLMAGNAKLFVAVACSDNLFILSTRGGRLLLPCIHLSAPIRYMTSDTWGKLLIVTDAECICWDISSFKKMYSCPVGHLLRSGVQDLKVTEGGCCRLQISSKESYMYDPAVGAWVGTFELDFPDAQVWQHCGPPVA
jgi:hypothetical protein